MISPHAGDEEGTERALATHLLCRGLAELVRRRGVAAPAKRARGGSVTLHPAEQSGCAGYGHTSGKIGIVHAAPRAGAGGLTGLRPNSHRELGSAGFSDEFKDSFRDSARILASVVPLTSFGFVTPNTPSGRLALLGATKPKQASLGSGLLRVAWTLD